MISKREAKAHPRSAKSIASYLSQVVPSEGDKVWIAQITQPIGWRQEFNVTDELTEEEVIERSKVLDRIKKFPPLQVKYEIVWYLLLIILFQFPHNVRPRTQLDALNGVYCSLKPLAEAKIDPNHPLNYLSQNCYVDGNFVKALHAMYSQFAIFTDFFDMKHNWQVISSLIIQNASAVSAKYKV